MYILARWVINASVLLLVAYMLPGFQVASFGWALIVALVLGIVNAIIRPILIILTLPINILSLGLFTFVINALMIMMVSALLEGFEVDTFATSLWAALILWAVSWFTNTIIKSAKHTDKPNYRPPQNPSDPPIIEG